MAANSPTALENKHPVGSVVDCVVKRVEPFGVYVRLAGIEGVAGFIKRQEWDRSWRSDVLAEVRPGVEVRAQIIAHGRPGLLRLSRRKTLKDPFPDFKKKHPVGEVTIGEVQFITSKAAGIILTLEGGTEGFVPRSEIPESGHDLDGFGLVPQDRVAARIIRFDNRANVSPVVLSIKEHLRARDAKNAKQLSAESGTLRYHPTLGVKLESLYWHYQLGEYEEPVLSPVVRERIRRILVVEDSKEVSTSLEVVFRHFNLRCDLADSLAQARARLAERSYDLLILDLDLSAERGAELLDDLRGSPALIYVFVLTGASADQWQHLLELPDAPPISIFQKPTGIDEIFRHLGRQLSAEAGPETEKPGPEAARQGAPAVMPVSWRGGRLAVDRRQRIEEIQTRLCKESGASQAFLLSRQPGRIFTLEAGSFVELTWQVQQNLEVSPVGAIINEHRVELVSDTDQRKAYFRHLREICPVGSFAGVSLDYGDQRRYGFFLLGEKRHQLKGLSKRRLRATAQSIGNLLAASRFDDVLAENQGLLLTGFLSDSLLHEIKNELQTLNNQAKIQLLLSRRHGDDLSALAGEELVDFTRATAEIQKISQRLDQLVVLFGNLAGRSPAERVNLGQTVRRLQSTLRPYARKRNVDIDLKLADDLPEILVNPRLVEQPLLNLMINGLEQMELRASPTRLLRITTELTGDPEFPLAVAVSDTGPGIHWVERKKIFDLFFTTKNKGTGLGLYLSRFFVEQFGGRLVLRESLMFTGSEFAIEIPKGALA